MTNVNAKEFLVLPNILSAMKIVHVYKGALGTINIHFP